MTTDKPKKLLVRRLIEAVGGAVLFVIRLWMLLVNPRRLRALLRLIRRKFRKPLGRMADRARRFRRRWTRPLEVRLKLLWRRIVQAHRRTSVPTLRTRYLTGFAVVIFGGALLAWLARPTKSPDELRNPAIAREIHMAKLVDQAAEMIRQNKLSKAEARIRELEEIQPDHPLVFALRGAVNSLRKDYDAARKEFARALELKPDDYMANFNAAEVEFAAGNYAAAQERFQKMYEKKTRDEVLIFRLFLCSLQRGDSRRQELLLARMPRTGKTPAWYYASAAQLFKAGRKSEARHLIKSARVFYPGKTGFFDKTLESLGWR